MAITYRSSARFALAALAALVPLAGCGPLAPPAAPPPAPVTGIPTPPMARGALAIDVVYPGENQVIAPVDSTFIFGSVGHGAATLTINGAPVAVAPNGGWLVYLPVPRDGRYELVAAAEGAEARAVRTVRVSARPAVAAAPGRLGIVPGTVRPAGALTVMRGEAVEARVQATPGATVHLVLPDGRRIPMAERPAVQRQEGFMLDEAAAAAALSEYVGRFAADVAITSPDTAVAVPTLARQPGHVEARESPTPATPGAARPGPATAAIAPAEAAQIELVRGTERVTVPVPASIAVLEPGAPRVAVTATTRPDSTTVARRGPTDGQPFEYFWPNGTRLVVDGESGGFYRVRLTDRLSTWVARGDVTLLDEGVVPVRGDVGPSMGVDPLPGWARIRFTASERVPFRLEPGTHGMVVEFYGASGRPGYVHYGVDEEFVRLLRWEQPADDVFRFHVELGERLWGFRTRWQGGALLLELRRPPRVDPRAPLRGLHVAIDAGHPPGGAIGPTRLTEADANLSVTRRLVPMLQARGARVLEVRPDTATVGLLDRVVLAHEQEPHLFVSVHFNAFPDGVNPFRNNGTIVFYYWPHAIELARHHQRELVAELGLRDLGVRFQNLAIPRIWSMPSVLTETLFMMIPEHEAALRNPAVQERIARAHLRALESFLAELSAEQTGGVR
jgi:N-acetylmuramoyl-L-alanine amidase